MNCGEKKNKPKKAIFLNKRKAVTTITIQQTSASTQGSQLRFNNGLFKDRNRYLQIPDNYSLIVGKRKNIWLPVDHEKAAGLLSISDYKSINCGAMSIDAMSYIIDYIIQPVHLNLTVFSDNIMKGQLTFRFSLNNKTCFVPYLDKGCWTLLFFNTKNNVFTYVSTQLDHEQKERDVINTLRKFITSYNENQKQKLKPLEYWKYCPYPNGRVIENTDDSGIFIVYCIYELSAQTSVQEFNIQHFKQTIQHEVLKYSEKMTDCCLICGKLEDNCNSESITWKACSDCGDWMHDTCFLNEEHPYACPFCKNIVI